MAETTPIALVRELGAELRQRRKAAGLGMRALAREAGLSTHSRISELESGKRLLSVDELGKIFQALNIAAGEREQLLGMARAAESPGQLAIGPPGQAQLIEYERIAVRITDGSPLLIPGLLQTTDYARAILGNKADSELRVTLRAGRRDILTRGRDPVQLDALIDSEALVRPVVPPEQMLDQLRHILRIVRELPNVTVRIVPSLAVGYHELLAGPFELLEFAKAAPIVLIEHDASATFLWEEDEVAKFVEAANHVRESVAMSSEESVDLIAEIVHGMERA